MYHFSDLKRHLESLVARKRSTRNHSTASLDSLKLSSRDSSSTICSTTSENERLVTGRNSIHLSDSNEFRQRSDTFPNNKGSNSTISLTSGDLTAAENDGDSEKKGEARKSSVCADCADFFVDCDVFEEGSRVQLQTVDEEVSDIFDHDDSDDRDVLNLYQPDALIGEESAGTSGMQLGKARVSSASGKVADEDARSTQRLYLETQGDNRTEAQRANQQSMNEIQEMIARRQHGGGGPINVDALRSHLLTRTSATKPPREEVQWLVQEDIYLKEYNNSSTKQWDEPKVELRYFYNCGIRWLDNQRFEINTHDFRGSTPVQYTVHAYVGSCIGCKNKYYYLNQKPERVGVGREKRRPTFKLKFRKVSRPVEGGGDEYMYLYLYFTTLENAVKFVNGSPILAGLPF